MDTPSCVTHPSCLCVLLFRFGGVDASESTEALCGANAEHLLCQCSLHYPLCQLQGRGAMRVCVCACTIICVYACKGRGCCVDLLMTIPSLPSPSFPSSPFSPPPSLPSPLPSLHPSPPPPPPPANVLLSAG